MTHQMLWNAIERLAKENGMTCSGMAKKCGLDATTFNKSKQFTANGAPRWPSCGTLAKVLTTLHVSPIEFAKMICEQ